jgi:MoxR-like ATPase
VDGEFSANSVAAFQQDFARLEERLGKSIVGQRPVIRQLLTAVVAGGHVLLEGLPGLGKTQLAKSLASGLGHGMARVQCTPDLMPGDITGSEVLVASEGAAPDQGLQELRFRPGPIFTSLLLVDEINRATSRTQSALLEAMQEHQVTHGGQQHRLPSPFWLIATQNPIELEGTYPLPEAQLDRFFFKCDVSYPDDEALLEIAGLSLDREPAEHFPRVLEEGRIEEMMKHTHEVVIAEAMKKRAVDLVVATVPTHPRASAAARRHVRYGASPRALQTLLRAARVGALADGRAHVSEADFSAMALPALRHRILLNIESEVEGVSADQVLEEILRDWAGSS